MPAQFRRDLRDSESVRLVRMESGSIRSKEGGPTKGNKKVNPRRRPATAADVRRAQNRAYSDAVTYCWAIFFSVLRDKEGWGRVRLRRLWEEVEALSQSIADGYVSAEDLRETMEAEAGIALKEGDQ